MEDITTMTSAEALKLYFGETKPVTNKELLELRRADPAGYDQMVTDAKEWLSRRPMRAVFGALT